MADDANLERRSAQALIATFMQMTRHAELAHRLQGIRQRAVARRLEKAAEPNQVARLQRQLDAQQSQGAIIESALGRLHGRAKELASFAEAGLTFEDFRRMGLEGLVSRDSVEAAHRAKEKRRKPEPADGKGGGAAAAPSTPTPPTKPTPTAVRKPRAKRSKPDPT